LAGRLFIFLFLSLAMVKRFSELENLRERGATETHGRGYLAGDLEQIRSFGTASATAAVLVFMMYIARPDVTVLYKHAGRLWLIVPLMLSGSTAYGCWARAAKWTTIRSSSLSATGSAWRWERVCWPWRFSRCEASFQPAGTSYRHMGIRFYQRAPFSSTIEH